VEWIVLCDEGHASSLAAAVLRALGLRCATDVVGGLRAWRAAGMPLGFAGRSECAAAASGTRFARQVDQNKGPEYSAMTGRRELFEHRRDIRRSRRIDYRPPRLTSRSPRG
jgi:hypothetical protein